MMMKKDAFKKYSGGIDTLRKKKEFITYLIMVIVLFGGGVFLGYYVWGIDKQQKPDYKKYLKDTIVYLQKMEENNTILSGEMKSLKTDVGILKKTIAESENKLAATSKRHEEKIALVEKENAALKLSISEKETAIADAKVIKAKFEELQNKFNVLKERVTPDKEAVGPSLEKGPAPSPVMEKEAVVSPTDTTKEVVDHATSEQEKLNTTGETMPRQGNHAVEEKTGEQ